MTMSKHDTTEEWLSRGEFERSITDLRQSITALANKIDSQTSKGTNWSAVSVILSAMVALGGVFSFAIFNKIDASDVLSSERLRTIQASVQGDIAKNNQRIERLELLEVRLRDVEINLAKGR